VIITKEDASEKRVGQLDEARGYRPVVLDLIARLRGPMAQLTTRPSSHRQARSKNSGKYGGRLTINRRTLSPFLGNPLRSGVDQTR
jgi:hypothetical protein